MKKSNGNAWLWLIFACLVAGVLWIQCAPVPAPRPYASVRVKVDEAPRYTEHEPEPEPEVAIIMPPPVPEPPPPPPDNKPKIAIVIDDVGLDIQDSLRAIHLPPYVTLSFLPYATRLKEQTEEARDNGHELLLHMPMEPVGRENPGPNALRVGLPPEELRRRFQTALASFTGFDGVNNHMGSKFTAYHDGMSMVVDELKQRGLFFLDSRTSSKTIGMKIAREQGLPTAIRDVFLDDDMSPESVRAQLELTERVARHKGYAIAIGHPHPATLSVLEKWLPEAEARGIKFVPVREMVDKAGK